MNKMNKKGFTLIEMLVVIAIIAILVAIIIPVVGNSTAKAEAATNAANLRSVKAEIVTAMLTGDTTNWNIPATPAAGATAAITAKDANHVPTFKGTGDDGSSAFAAVMDSNRNVTVTFGNDTISEWAAKAS